MCAMTLCGVVKSMTTSMSSQIIFGERGSVGLSAAASDPDFVLALACRFGYQRSGFAAA